SQVFALLLELKSLWIARQGWTASSVFKDPTRAFHQLLLRQHASLQSSDRSIDPGILFLGATVKQEKDQTSNDKHGNTRQAANPKCPPFFVDSCHHPLGSVSIFLGTAQPLAKLVRDGFIPQLRTDPRPQFL